MKEYHFPPCKQQKEFEDLAVELIKVLATLDENKQIDIFEYAQNVAYESKKKEG